MKFDFGISTLEIVEISGECYKWVQGFTSFPENRGSTFLRHRSTFSLVKFQLLLASIRFEPITTRPRLNEWSILNSYFRSLRLFVSFFPLFSSPRVCFSRKHILASKISTVTFSTKFYRSVKIKPLSLLRRRFISIRVRYNLFKKAIRFNKNNRQLRVFKFQRVDRQCRVWQIYKASLIFIV